MDILLEACSCRAPLARMRRVTENGRRVIVRSGNSAREHCALAAIAYDANIYKPDTSGAEMVSGAADDPRAEHPTHNRLIG